MLSHFVPWFGVTLTVVVSVGAFWKGDREQQAAIGAGLLSLALTLALRDPTWAGTQWSAFGADTALMAFLLVLALRSDRYWPMAAAAFQLLCVVTHLARIVDPGVRAWAYATGQVIWSQAVFWSIGFGIWNTWRMRSAAAAVVAGQS